MSRPLLRCVLKSNLVLSVALTSSQFEDAGLHPVMLENIKLCGYGAPTPVQAATIPAVKTGHDVIAIAQTGSGKTASYLIPTISMLMGKAKKLCSKRPGLANGFNSETDVVRAEPLILVVAPTRELATQIFDESRRLCYRSMLRPCVAYGGAPSRDQKDELRKGCDILIGTPGRLCDFLNDARLLSLKRLRYVVIDEADELLDSDWESEIGRLMSGGGKHHPLWYRYPADLHTRLQRGCRYSLPHVLGHFQS